MNKKLVSMLALALSVCTLAGCGGGNGGGNSSSGSGNSGGGGNTPLTQTQIYAKVMEAADATAAYTGAYTVEGVNNYSYKSGSYESASENALKVSVDIATKQIYVSNTSKRTNKQGEGEAVTETRATLGKFFKEGDKYYTYSKNTSGEMSQEQYAIVSDEAVDSMSEEYSLSSLSEMLTEEVIDVKTSVEETNAAFATVFADSKAAVTAASTDEDSEWYGASVDGSAAISCVDNNGEYSVSMAISFEMAMDGEACEMSAEIKLVAKDGKLTTISMKENAKETETVSDAGETPVEEVDFDNSEMTYNISYAFAQADFDGIVTQIPADVQEAPNSEYYSKDINVVLNGVECDNAYASGSTVEEALKDITESPWRYSNMDIVWYTDAACTKALDPSKVTADEFEAMDTLYGKATAEEGYVLVKETYVDAFAADVPDAYKLVFGDMGMLDLEEECDLESRYVGSTIYVDEDPTVTTYVNGQVVTESVTIEAGKTYEVKYVSTYAKADLNIFDFLG